MNLAGLLRDPIVAPLFIALVLILAILAISIVRAFQTDTFEPTLLPKFLKDYVLAEWIPIAVLALVVWTFGIAYPDQTRDIPAQIGLVILTTMYTTASVALGAKYVAKLVDLFRGPDPGLHEEIDQEVTGDEVEVVIDNPTP